jgi:hypothetical protein
VLFLNRKTDFCYSCGLFPSFDFGSICIGRLFSIALCRLSFDLFMCSELIFLLVSSSCTASSGNRWFVRSVLFFSRRNLLSRTRPLPFAPLRPDRSLSSAPRLFYFCCVHSLGPDLVSSFLNCHHRPQFSLSRSAHNQAKIPMQS